MNGVTRDGTAELLSRETYFSGANRDREEMIFPVQLTTSKIGYHTVVTHILLYVLTIYTCIHRNKRCNMVFFLLSCCILYVV